MSNYIHSFIIFELKWFEKKDFIWLEYPVYESINIFVTLVRKSMRNIWMFNVIFFLRSDSKYDVCC